MAPIKRLKMALCHTTLCLLCFIAMPQGAGAQTVAEEYQIKAVYLYNFAKFVYWPDSAFVDATAPIIIGVVGKNPFGDVLSQAVAGETLNNRPLQVTHFKTMPINTCHILFVSRSENENLTNILETAHKHNVLTVGETDEFIKRGGMVRFVFENNRVRYDIAPTVAQQADIRISSKMLKLARRIINTRQE